MRDLRQGALEEVEAIAPVVTGGLSIARALLAELPERLRQPAFERTGGLHAPGLFAARRRAALVREDVGRHNAMDKVIGRALLDGLLPLSEHVLCVSGRLAFELVQKTARAGAPILVGVGAPNLTGRGAGGRPRHHAGRVRPRRAGERVHARAARGAAGRPPSGFIAVVICFRLPMAVTHTQLTAFLAVVGTDR